LAAGLTRPLPADRASDGDDPHLGLLEARTVSGASAAPPGTRVSSDPVAQIQAKDRRAGLPESAANATQSSYDWSRATPPVTTILNRGRTAGSPAMSSAFVTTVFSVA
jgi:hypothetical protein